MSNTPEKEENAPILIVSNDFSAVNRYIENLLQRQEALISDRKSTSFLRTCLGVSAVVVAFGVLAIGIIWAMSSPPPLSAKDIFQEIETQHPAAVSKSSSSRQSVDVKFTVFKSVRLDDGRDVVTGHNFLPSDISAPFYQYCYIATPESSNSLQQKFVGTKSKSEVVQWIADLESMDYLLAKEHCHFLHE